MAHLRTFTAASKASFLPDGARQQYQGCSARSDWVVPWHALQVIKSVAGQRERVKKKISLLVDLRLFDPHSATFGQHAYALL